MPPKKLVIKPLTRTQQLPRLPISHPCCVHLLPRLPPRTAHARPPPRCVLYRGMSGVDCTNACPGPPVLPVDFEGETWTKLQAAVHAVYAATGVSFSEEELYQVREPRRLPACTCLYVEDMEESRARVLVGVGNLAVAKLLVHRPHVLLDLTGCQPDTSSPPPMCGAPAPCCLLCIAGGMHACRRFRTCVPRAWARACTAGWRGRWGSRRRGGRSRTSCSSS